MLPQSKTAQVLSLAVEAMHRGLVILTCGTYGNVVRILVPLTASDELIDEGLNMVSDALHHLQGQPT